MTLFGADAYLGWTGAINDTAAAEFAKKLFLHLSAGKYLQWAIEDAVNDLPILFQLWINENYRVIGSGGVVVDMTP